MLMSVVGSSGFAQQAQPQSQTNPTAPAPVKPVQNDTTGQPGLPQAPAPRMTEPMYLRDTPKDYTRGRGNFFKNPLLRYQPNDFDLPRLQNTPRLDGLLRDGKIYLSLSDAITLTLENNFDIAIARINLDIADTDILRTKAGFYAPRGVSTGLVTGTLGSSGTTVTGGGGPGGTSSSSGGAGTGANGLVLSTNGGGTDAGAA